MTTPDNCLLHLIPFHGAAPARRFERVLGLVLLAASPFAAACATSEPAPPEAEAPRTAPIVIPDDFEAARARAVTEGRPLLVNFTGHTCVNCRKMEDFVFERAPVAAARAGFIEARLHSDAADPALRADIVGRIESIAKSPGMPIYVVLDPRTGDEFARYEGAALADDATFQVFLEQAAASWQRSQG